MTTTVIIIGGPSDAPITTYSTSDQCPIPYCTIEDESGAGDRCGTQKECDSVMGKNTVAIVMIVLFALVVFGILLRIAYKSKSCKKCFKKTGDDAKSSSSSDEYERA